MKNIHSNRGFTLVEIMVAVAVLGVLMTGVMTFYLQGVKSMYASEQRLKLAGQIKKFSNELIVQASRANQFVLYKSASPADFDGVNPTFIDPITTQVVPFPDRQRIDITDPLNPLHPAGDFVVFVYFKIPKDTADAVHRISKLEGYYLNPASAGGIGAVTKVVIDLTAAPSLNSIESILNTDWNNSTTTFTKYFPLARGLCVPEIVDGTAVTGTPVSRLFYMTASRNVIVSGQLYSSRPDVATGDWKTYTDVFFFNITPRT